ncbi:MAG: amidohydrolase family protein [Acidimicrobiales bacterium]|nr:amidohydrolase family protein [Acidimicrobiales bacterium]
MPYAEGRTFFDADSHIMELPDWLVSHADPAMRDRIPPLSVSSGGPMAEKMQRYAEAGGHPADKVEELLRNVIAGPKNYEALGAFNAAERTRALDELGFRAQWVFASFSPAQVFWIRDLEARYAACRAHNRAMSEFCGDDPRLLPVALLSLDDPALAAVELDAALAEGAKGIWVPAGPCGGRSPGHDELDPIWARMAEAGVPFLLHVGGQAIQIRSEYMNTGRPQPTDWLGGAENVRSKDLTVLHQSAEEFLSVMVLDGVLERHRGLRGAAVELGATWVPGMLRRLDHAAEIWARSEPELRTFTRIPSEQVRAQLAFTPYPFEDVGALIRDSSPELYLFSSDYPHTEGGRNPIGRFESSLGDLDEAVRRAFYCDNFLRLLPSASALAD